MKYLIQPTFVACLDMWQYFKTWVYLAKRIIVRWHACISTPHSTKCTTYLVLIGHSQGKLGHFTAHSTQIKWGQFRWNENSSDEMSSIVKVSKIYAKTYVFSKTVHHWNLGFSTTTEGLRLICLLKLYTLIWQIYSTRLDCPQIQVFKVVSKNGVNHKFDNVYSITFLN